MIARCDTAIGLQGGLPASSHHQQAKIDETPGTSNSKAGAGVGLVLEFQATVRRSAGVHVGVRDDVDGEMAAPSCRPMWFTAEDNAVSLSVASCRSLAAEGQGVHKHQKYGNHSCLQTNTSMPKLLVELLTGLDEGGVFDRCIRSPSAVTRMLRRCRPRIRTPTRLHSRSPGSSAGGTAKPTSFRPWRYSQLVAFEFAPACEKMPASIHLVLR